MLDAKNIHDAKGNVLAIHITGELRGLEEYGTHFLTRPAEQIQVAVLYHPRGKVIMPHLHQLQTRQVEGTVEVLIVRRGILEVELYGDEWEVQKVYIHAGEILILLSGGHGFHALTDIEVVEVKQGPYDPQKDKIPLR